MNYILIRFLATGRQTYNGLLLRLLNHAYTFMSIFEETVRLIDIWLNCMEMPRLLLQSIAGDT